MVRKSIIWWVECHSNFWLYFHIFHPIQVNLVQRTTNIAELEADEIFQHELLSDPAYIDAKNFLNSKLSDFEQIKKDYEQQKNDEEQQRILIEQSRLKLNDIKNRNSKLQVEVEKLSRDEAALQKRLTARAAKDDNEREEWLKTIGDLQMKLEKAENEVDALENNRIKVISEFTMKLKIQKKKTEEIRARQASVTSAANNMVKSFISSHKPSDNETSPSRVVLSATNLVQHNVSVTNSTLAPQPQAPGPSTPKGPSPKKIILNRRPTISGTKLPVYKDVDSQSEVSVKVIAEKAFETDDDSEVSFLKFIVDIDVNIMSLSLQFNQTYNSVIGDFMNESD